MSQGFSLKDQLINAGKVEMLAGWLSDALPGFDAAGFQAQVMGQLPALELKARILWIAEVLEDHLPKAFPAAAEVIHKALPPELDPSKSDDDFGDFIIDPFGQFVARNGLEDLDVSLPLLHALTRRFSMEFAIRPFLIRHKGRMQTVLAGRRTRTTTCAAWRLKARARSCPGGSGSGGQNMRRSGSLIRSTPTRPAM